MPLGGQLWECAHSVDMARPQPIHPRITPPPLGPPFALLHPAQFSQASLLPCMPALGAHSPWQRQGEEET